MNAFEISGIEVENDCAADQQAVPEQLVHFTCHS